MDILGFAYRVYNNSCIYVWTKMKKEDKMTEKKLSKEGKPSEHKWEKIDLSRNPYFADGSYIWYCKKCGLWVFSETRPQHHTQEPSEVNPEEFVVKWRNYLFERFPISITGNAHNDWDDEIKKMLKEYDSLREGKVED